MIDRLYYHMKHDWGSDVDVGLHLLYFFFVIQADKKPQEMKEKPAIEENAFEALERDFQEVCFLPL